jgi:hypothetical protein
VNDNIINSYWKCDPNTGYWLSQGDWPISDGAPSVAENTGLAAVLLGDTDGYRVYYHDNNMTLRQLGYTSDTSWQDEGSISQDENLGNAIAAVFTSKNGNITVAAPKGSDNIEVSRWFSDDSWHISKFHPTRQSSKQHALMIPSNTDILTQQPFHAPYLAT